MNAVSETLFHFIDRVHRNEPAHQLEVFKSIMENGLKFSDVVVNHLEAKFSNKGICFTDIPLSLSDEHTESYGKFGIGFSREFVKNKGGNPVFYFVNWNDIRSATNPDSLRGILSDNLKTVAKFCLAISNLEKEHGSIILRDKNGKDIEYKDDLLANHMRQLFSMFKEIGDLGPASDYTRRKDVYYLEREWRIISYALHGDNTISTKIGNDIFLKIKQSDIRIITVPNEDTRKAVLNYFEERKQSNPSDVDKQYVPSVIIYDELKMI